MRYWKDDYETILLISRTRIGKPIDYWARILYLQEESKRVKTT